MTTSPTMELPTLDGHDPMGTIPAFPDPDPDAPTPPGSKTADPNAPYGYTADGAPRGKPGRKPSGKAPAAPAPKKAAQKPPTAPTPKKAAGTPRPPQKAARVDYTSAIGALLGQFIAPATIVAVAKHDSTLLADCAAITDGVPAMGQVANWAAEKWPVAAAILDKVVAFGAVAGPAGGLIAMAAQLGVNHGLIPPGLVPRTLPPAEYATRFVERKMQEDADFAMAIQAIAQAQAGAAVA